MQELSKDNKDNKIIVQTESNPQNNSSEQQVITSNIILEEFMNHFDELLSQIKYNLQSFNKKCDSMDRCFGNVLLLKSNKPFDEEENQEDEMQKQIDELYSEYNPNNMNKKQSKRKNKENLKITSKELNNIEKMFEDMNQGRKAVKKKGDLNMNYSDKKKKQGRAPYKYMYEIDKILKGVKLKMKKSMKRKIENIIIKEKKLLIWMKMTMMMNNLLIISY